VFEDELPWRRVALSECSCIIIIIIIIIIMPPPQRVGHNALMAVVRRLSVCLMPDPKSKTEGRSKLEIDMKEAHDTMTDQ